MLWSQVTLLPALPSAPSALFTPFSSTESSCDVAAASTPRGDRLEHCALSAGPGRLALEFLPSKPGTRPPPEGASWDVGPRSTPSAWAVPAEAGPGPGPPEARPAGGPLPATLEPRIVMGEETCWAPLLPRAALPELRDREGGHPSLNPPPELCSQGDPPVPCPAPDPDSYFTPPSTPTEMACAPLLGPEPCRDAWDTQAELGDSPPASPSGSYITADGDSWTSSPSCSLSLLAPAEGLDVPSGWGFSPPGSVVDEQELPPAGPPGPPSPESSISADSSSSWSQDGHFFELDFLANDPMIPASLLPFRGSLLFQVEAVEVTPRAPEEVEEEEEEEDALDSTGDPAGEGEDDSTFASSLQSLSDLSITEGMDEAFAFQDDTSAASSDPDSASYAGADDERLYSGEPHAQPAALLHDGPGEPAPGVSEGEASQERGAQETGSAPASDGVSAAATASAPPAQQEAPDLTEVTSQAWGEEPVSIPGPAPAAGTPLPLWLEDLAPCTAPEMGLTASPHSPQTMKQEASQDPDSVAPPWSPQDTGLPSGRGSTPIAGLPTLHVDADCTPGIKPVVITAQQEEQVTLELRPAPEERDTSCTGGLEPLAWNEAQPDGSLVELAADTGTLWASRGTAGTPKSATEAANPPQPVTEAPECPEPATEATDLPQPATEAPEYPKVAMEALEHPKTTTEATEHPESATEIPEHPKSVTETLEHPRPATEAPEHPEPVTEVLEHSEPSTGAPEHSEPVMAVLEHSVTEVLEHSEPATGAPEHPEPVTEVLEHSEPSTGAQEHSEPVTAVLEHSVTEVLEHSEPATGAPEHSEPVTEVLEHSKPATETPEHSEPVTAVLEHSVTEVLEHPEPVAETMEYPEPATEALELPKVATEAPEHPETATEAPEFPTLTTEAPEHLELATETLEHPETATEAPELPTLTTEAPEHLELATETLEHVRPDTEALELPKPAMEALKHPEPATEALELPKLAMVAPEPYEPATETPEQAGPATEALELPKLATEAPEHSAPATETLEHPEPPMETLELPKLAMETPEHSEPATEALEHPEPPLETLELPKLAMEAPEPSEPAMKTPEQAGPAAEALELPKLATGAPEYLEPVTETLEHPEHTTEVLEHSDSATVALELPEPTTEDLEYPELAVEAPAPPEPAREALECPKPVSETTVPPMPASTEEEAASKWGVHPGAGVRTVNAAGPCLAPKGENRRAGGLEPAPQGARRAHPAAPPEVGQSPPEARANPGLGFPVPVASEAGPGHGSESPPRSAPRLERGCPKQPAPHSPAPSLQQEPVLGPDSGACAQAAPRAPSSSPAQSQKSRVKGLPSEPPVRPLGPEPSAPPVPTEAPLTPCPCQGPREDLVEGKEPPGSPGLQPPRAGAQRAAAAFSGTMKPPGTGHRVGLPPHSPLLSPKTAPAGNTHAKDQAWRISPPCQVPPSPRGPPAFEQPDDQDSLEEDSPPRAPGSGQGSAQHSDSHGESSAEPEEQDLSGARGAQCPAQVLGQGRVQPREGAPPHPPLGGSDPVLPRPRQAVAVRRRSPKLSRVAVRRRPERWVRGPGWGASPGGVCQIMGPLRPNGR
uniref:NAC-A/B domain-containing protein n=1 Tax=Suricata suricatta TaxID=37032 RepID=A0A673T0S5_SURSU